MADPNARRVRLLASLYATFGVEAEWTPAGGGSATPCTVRSATDDAVLDFGRSKAVGDQELVKVRISEVAAPAKGDVFAVGERDMRVMGTPRRAHNGLEWICEVAEVAG